jgi:Na+/H+ antiporter NhaD/arsenite permease-like protein
VSALDTEKTLVEHQGDGGEAPDGDPSRLDRELVELLNELRVMIPGVQVLFAFLLTVPFTNRFADARVLERSAYAVSFGCATVCSVLLLTPSVYHRTRFRQRDKERLLRWSNRLTIAASAVLAVGIASSVLLVVGFLYSDAWGVVAAGIALALAAALWFVLPISGGSRRRR